MTSVIHFKFRSALLSETLNFDGDYLSLLDLKRLIAKKKGLLNAADIDFAITNKQTGEGLNHFNFIFIHSSFASCDRSDHILRFLSYLLYSQSTLKRTPSFRRTQKFWLKKSMPSHNLMPSVPIPPEPLLRDQR